MHRISDVRVGGVTKRNLRMLRKLCGSDSLKNVVIVTTMWGSVAQEVGIRREEELKSKNSLFKPLLDAGAQIARHDDSVASAHVILNDLLLNDPQMLLIQKELREGKSLVETAAGGELTADLNVLMEKHRKEMLNIREEMAAAIKAKDMESKKELEAEREHLEAEVKRWKADKRKLEAGLNSMRAEMEAYKKASQVEMEKERLAWFGKLQEKLRRQELEAKAETAQKEPDALAKAGYTQKCGVIIHQLTTLPGDDRREAVQELSKLLQNDPAQAITATDAGAIHPLVDLLASDFTAIRAEAAGALMEMAAHDLAKAAMFHANALPPLIHLLASQDEYIQKNASGALMEIVQYEPARVFVVNTNAISSLVRLLASEDVGVLGYAIRALSNLVCRTFAVDCPEKAIAVSEGVIPALVRLLASKNMSIQQYALEYLLVIITDFQDGRSWFACEENIPVVIGLLTSENKGIIETALAVLMHFADSAYHYIERCNGIPHLVRLLDSGDMVIKKNALRVLSNGVYNPRKVPSSAIVPLLTSEDPDIQRYAIKTFYSSGPHYVNPTTVIPTLLRMIASEDTDVQGYAASALSWFSETNESGAGIPSLVRLLYSEDEGVRASAVRALGSLMECDSARAAAVFDTNAIPHLVRMLNFKKPDDWLADALMLVTMYGPAKTAVLHSNAIPALVRMLGAKISGRNRFLPVLLNIAEHDQAKAAVLEENPIPVLQDMATSNPWNAEVAVTLLQKLTTHDTIAIPPLVHLLSSEDIGVQENAAGSLMATTVHFPQKAAALSANAIPALIRLLASKRTNVQADAAGALGNIAEYYLARCAIHRADALPALARLAASESAVVQHHALAALSSIIRSWSDWRAISDSNAALIVRRLTSSNTATQEYAAKLLENVADCPAVSNANPIPFLAQLLTSDSLAVQRNAVKAIGRLSACGAAKAAIPGLIHLLASKNIIIQTDVVQSLSALIRNHSRWGGSAFPIQDIFPVLNNLLASEDVCVQRNAVCLLEAVVSMNRAATFDANIIPILSRLLASKDSEVLRYTLRALSAINYHVPARTNVLETIPALVELLTSNRTDPNNVTSILSTFTASAPAKAAALDANAIPALVHILLDDTTCRHSNAVSALSNITEYAPAKAAALDANAIPALVHVLRNPTYYYDSSYVLGALSHILEYAPAKAVALDANAIPAVQMKFSNTQYGVKELAQRIVRNLTASD